MLFSDVRPTVLALLVGVTVLGLGALAGSHLTAAPPSPSIDQGVLAALYAGSLTLTGDNLGESPPNGAIQFDYEGGSIAVPADSPRVQVWQEDVIELTLPPEVLSGQVTVTVDGLASAADDLLVFDYVPVDVPPSLRTNDAPLAIALAPDGTLWINSEFHLEVKALSGDLPPAYTALEIPQSEGPGIFASTIFADQRARLSTLGEDIVVDGDGAVWFTQGGGYLYEGAFPNASRIVRYDPSTEEFSCYIAPVDNAQVMGILNDETRGIVWYAESSFENGGAVTGFRPGSVTADCLHDPDKEGPKGAVCTEGLAGGCHWRFTMPDPRSAPAHLALDADGNIWITEFFGNSIGRLTPETGEIIELPLPAPIVRQGPGLIVGGGPWELAFDGNGDLWVSEYFDATVLRVKPSLLKTGECRQLDALGQNPCIEEVLVASDGIDGNTIPTVSVGADGLVWFGVETHGGDGSPADSATIGFISPTDGGAATFLPNIAGVRWIAGIAQDLSSRDVWFAQFGDHRVGRLRQLGAGDADGDGVPDSKDNCVVVPNSGQEAFRVDGPGRACANVDEDGDGCSDADELGSNPHLGGQRNPDNPWDYFNPSGDGKNRIDDILIVTRSYSQSQGDAGYSPQIDRTGIVNGHPWSLGPPDGHIRIDDIIAIINSYYHDCGGELS